MEYANFITNKLHNNQRSGFEPVWMPDFLFPVQESLVNWSINKGRGAIFADCGLGKTPMSLVWAQNVVEKTNGRVLIITPLAVGAQFLDESEKFGVEAVRRSIGDNLPKKGIVITNYEKLHLFNSNDFVGCVCDESSILKNFSGTRRKDITVFMRKLPYRLLTTATAAPNDYIELGTSSESLGYLGHMDMLNKFFKNNQNNSSTGRHRGQVVKWRLKGHAELPFWRWVCSWARAVRKPSDLGFDDDRFVLPELTENCHVVKVNSTADGMLFNLPAHGLQEQREERKRSITERCEKMAELAITKDDYSLLWCYLNDEGNLLEKLIPDSIQVSGKDSDQAKEFKLMEFQRGNAKTLITKPKIGAWGLNFQHCNHVLTFPSHSFESYYQSIRRCWRFGQTRPVSVDVITTEGEQDVLKNLQRKANQAEVMFDNMISEMNQSMSLESIVTYNKKQELPKWL